MSLLMRGAFALMSTILVPGIAFAQKVPDARQQEVLIKSTLMSFNDANVTDNYAVFHAKLAKPFREQFSADKLKGTFKVFIEQKIDIDFIVARPPVADEPAVVDDDGVLKINGHFEGPPSNVTYKLKFIRSDGDWKSVGINVNLPASAPASEPKKSDAGKVEFK